MVAFKFIAESCRGGKIEVLRSFEGSYDIDTVFDDPVNTTRATGIQISNQRVCLILYNIDVEKAFTALVNWKEGDGVLDLTVYQEE